MNDEWSQIAANAIANAADRASCSAQGAAWQWERPSVLMRPALSLDGDMYCALYGANLMEGCAGFGETAAAAMADFDKNWGSLKAPKRANSPLPQSSDGREASESKAKP